MRGEVMTDTNIASLDIDGERLMSRISTLAKFGQDSETGGINRTGFSAADREGQAYLIQEARRAGLTAKVDAAGNVIIRRPAGATSTSPRKALMMGSHLDTVVNGGRLDGAYGVLAALEVVQTLTERGTQLPLELVVIAFANEEGAMFPYPFWGSMAVAGRLSELPLDPRDRAGNPLRDALRLSGGDLAALGTASWEPGSVACYLELHIEQGPVLERSGDRIGVVEAITGRAVLTLEVRGAAGHSGTTPMAGRRDAAVAAARVVLAAESLAYQGLCRVATVGHIEPYPNTPNTIAGTVRMTVDIRDVDQARLSAAEASLRRAVEEIEIGTGTEIVVVGETRSTPVATDPALCAAIADSARELGLPHATLPSGAGHDAQMVADIAPIGMIFAPSLGGLSHVPEEDTDPADLVDGARVLLRTAERILNRA